MPDVSRSTLDGLLIYAARYAFGRYTYANSDVIDAVRKHGSRHVYEVLVHDLDRALPRLEATHPYREDLIALRDWMRERLAKETP